MTDTCKRGHPYDTANTARSSQRRSTGLQTYRVCRRCQADAQARSKAYRAIYDLYLLLLTQRGITVNRKAPR